MSRRDNIPRGEKKEIECKNCHFGIIIANNYIFNPWVSAIFEIDIMMEIPPDMWGLLKLGVGGYVVGRSAEKGLAIWKEKQNGS